MSYEKTTTRSASNRSSRTTQTGAVSWSGGTIWWDDYLFGHYLPDYRKRIVRGSDATTEMYATSRTIEAEAGELGGGYYVSSSHTPANYREVIDRGIIAPAFWPSADPAIYSAVAADRQATGQIWQRFSAARNSIQAGTFIGEIGQTIKMVRNRGKSMMGLLTRWNTRLRTSKRYRRTKEDRRKEAADAHLEWSFGMRPLISDISGALSIFDEPRRVLKHCRGSGKEERVYQTSIPNEGSVGPIVVTSSTRVGSTVRVQYCGAVKAQTEGIRGIRDRLGCYPKILFLRCITFFLGLSF